jgi:hypothetical protein
MIHPHTQLREVSAQVGLGVYAAETIPAGTIVYVKDLLETSIRPDDPMLRYPAYRKSIDTYCYSEPDGTRVLSWDLAKYVNHSCRPNSLSTGYGFEIALTDIAPGEQITDDYGVFIGPEVLTCCCGHPDCRGVVRWEDFSRHVDAWDRRVQLALTNFRHVSQPLLGLLDSSTRRSLQRYLRTGKGYRSLAAMRPIIEPGRYATMTSPEKSLQSA